MAAKGWKTHSNLGDRGFVNLNGMLITGIDCETTGLQAGWHDLIEFACIAVDAQVKVMTDVPIFETLLKLKRPQNIDAGAMAVNGISLEEIERKGMDAHQAADAFVDWFEGLGLKEGKQLCYLGKNWAFDRPFIEDWLGPENTRRIFWHRFRDITPIVLWMNDRAEWHGEDPPFPQTSLQQVRHKLGILNRREHRAADDALIAIDCYRMLMDQEVFA